MNLCGGGVEQQISTPLCGPCTKAEDPNESILSDEEASLVESSDDRVAQRLALDQIESALGLIASDEEHLIKLKKKAAPPAPPPQALSQNTRDFLRRTIQPENPSTSRGRTRLQMPRDVTSTPRQLHDVPAASNMTIACSPSPLLLNPLSDEDWDSQHKNRKHARKPNLIASRIDNSGAMDKLMQRLEEGFRLIMMESASEMSQVFLYLHKDRDRLCIRSLGEEEKKVESCNWREIPITKIMRLEVRKKDPRNPSAPGRGFSVIVNEDANIKYYDFEASSALDREVLLSTLVVVLEQMHNPLDTRPTQPPSIPSLPDDGTMEQPILCSPSLEDSKIVSQDSMMTKISMSDLSSRKLPIGPRPESCPVIDVEDSSVRKLELPYGMSMTSFQSNRPFLAAVTEDDHRLMERVDEKGRIESKTSNAQVNASWCDEDVCTLALRDMAYTCSGIFDQKNVQRGSVARGMGCAVVGTEQAAMVEEYIATALGAPGAVYSYFATAGRDVWEVGHEQDETPAPDGSKPSAVGGLRNRASKLNAQANRLKNLRNEMTFAAALQESQEKMRYIQTTQSCDDIERRGYSGAKGRAAEAVLNRFHASALLRTVVGNMNSGVNEVQDEPEEYYDSDPEDARPVLSKLNPRNVRPDPDVSIERPQRQRALSGAGFDKRGSGKRISKKMNEEVIVQLVQAMNNERLLLMWHPSQTRENPNRPPMCVRFWIESGVYLIDGTFLLPKLTWSKVSESSRGQQLKITEEGLNKLDLLDICRIRPARRVDRVLHPFAERRKCFEIETQSACFLFESESQEERDRIVYGLKLVVARLASLLMLRDFRAAEEFFGQMSAGVPGDAPAWVTGRES